MSDQDLINRLARASAHGTRQMGFVNELLAGPSYVKINAPFDHVSYGDSQLGGKSWAATKKRLVANGFIITMTPWDRGRRTVEMRFSV